MSDRKPQKPPAQGPMRSMYQGSIRSCNVALTLTVERILKTFEYVHYLGFHTACGTAPGGLCLTREFYDCESNPTGQQTSS